MKLLSTGKTAIVVISLVLVSFALGAFGDSKPPRAKTDIYHDLEVFAGVIEKVQAYYVDEVDTHELVREAIDGMLSKLDPHSQFLADLEYEDLMVSTRGEFGGLGIFISFRDNYPTVISAIDDTPAYRAGIRGGDQIIEIEGMVTEGWAVDRAVGYLRGDPGTPVSFKISRPGSREAIEYAITREIINVKSVPYYDTFGEGVGYIKVGSFSKHTAQELEDALLDLEAQGMKRLVLDFRMNPGGLLQAATEVSEMFLDKDKLLVFTKGRLPNANRKYYSSNRKVHGGYPIVVMINGHSASASEIFAGAMQDWDAALVVGQTTFGKGTVQTVFNLSETEAVKLTTAKYYTPSGRSIHKDQPTDEEEAAQLAAVSEGGEEYPAPLEEMQGADDQAGLPKEKQDEDRPVYYTSGGRMVYGGGGIAPDLELEPREYTDLQRRLEREAVGFSFVVDYFTSHEYGDQWEADDRVLEDFYAHLDTREFKYKKDELTEENVAYIRTMLAREAANNQAGRSAAYRVVTEDDPEFQHVLSIMGSASSLTDLFAYAEQQKGIKKASAD
ncbi:MAG: S41 family peptidase [Candidatus Krumholzibacteria bacterium]|nr:S41 family peptidase [Candidatus Krumholzibacteria bacterium]